MAFRWVPLPVRSRRRAIGIAVLTFACVALFACSPSSDEDRAMSGNAAISDVGSRTGQEIFASTCAVCHGALGEGQPNWHIPKTDRTLPPPPLNGDGHTWHHGDGFLYRVIRDGGKSLESPSLPHFKSGMPAFGEQLSQEEIVGVITYVKSLWGEKTGRGMSIQKWQTEVSLNDPFPLAP